VDPGDVGPEPKGRPVIWAAVYLVNKESVPFVEMFFTVATDSRAAEESFIAELGTTFEGVSDLAPERIVQLPLVGSSEPVHAAVARLETMGYKFAMPVRDQIPVEHIGKLVYALLNFSETDRDE
jgi:hypothetical protein